MMIGRSAVFADGFGLLTMSGESEIRLSMTSQFL